MKRREPSRNWGNVPGRSSGQPKRSQAQGGSGGGQRKGIPKRAGVPAEFRDASRGERLQKVLAAAGVASRRDCEKLIEQGAVTVNGQQVSALPAWVDAAHDKICVDGQPIRRAVRSKGWGRDAGADDMVYLAVHKPRGVIATTHDDLGRRSVLDLIELPRAVEVMMPRIFPVGRLDADSTGLILLTNDGDLANKLTHPRYQIPKEYEATVRGRLTEDDVQRLREGLFAGRSRGGAADPEAASGEVKIRGIRKEDLADSGRDDAGERSDKGDKGDRTVLSITLREGPMREIRMSMEHLGYKVNRLKRIAIGPIRLKGLGAGKWRALSPTEITQLRAAVSESSRGRR